MARLSQGGGRGPGSAAQVQIEVKHRMLAALSKLSDRDTQQLAVEELQRMAEALRTPEGIATCLSCICDTEASPHNSKSAAKRECVKLLGTLALLHGAHLLPHLPKILASILRRLKDPDTSVRDACVDAIATLSSTLVVAAGPHDTNKPTASHADHRKASNNSHHNMHELTSFVKPFFEALSEQNRNVQHGAALCLARIIATARAPPNSASMARLSHRVCRLLANPCFLAKWALLPVISSLSQVGAISEDWSVGSMVPCVQEALESSDWATRKAAAETLSRMASTLPPHLLARFQPPTLSILHSCRFDKVKPVRDSVQDAIQSWKALELPSAAAAAACNEHLNPPPSNPVAAPDATTRSQLCDDRCVTTTRSSPPPRLAAAAAPPPSRRPSAPKKRGANAFAFADKRPNPQFFNRLAEAAATLQQPDEWHIEVAVPRHGPPPRPSIDPDVGDTVAEPADDGSLQPAITDEKEKSLTTVGTRRNINIHVEGQIPQEASSMADRSASAGIHHEYVVDIRSTTTDSLQMSSTLLHKSGLIGLDDDSEATSSGRVFNWPTSEPQGTHHEEDELRQQRSRADEQLHLLETLDRISASTSMRRPAAAAATTASQFNQQQRHAVANDAAVLRSRCPTLRHPSPSPGPVASTPPPQNNIDIDIEENREFHGFMDSEFGLKIEPEDVDAAQVNAGGGDRANNWSLIHRQLSQLEFQQAAIMELLQEFMGSSKGNMASLEWRIKGIENVMAGLQELDGSAAAAALSSDDEVAPAVQQDHFYHHRRHTALYEPDDVDAYGGQRFAAAAHESTTTASISNGRFVHHVHSSPPPAHHQIAAFSETYVRDDVEDVPAPADTDLRLLQQAHDEYLYRSSSPIEERSAAAENAALLQSRIIDRDNTNNRSSGFMPADDRSTSIGRTSWPEPERTFSNFTAKQRPKLQLLQASETRNHDRRKLLSHACSSMPQIYSSADHQNKHQADQQAKSWRAQRNVQRNINDMLNDDFCRVVEPCTANSGEVRRASACAHGQFADDVALSEGNVGIANDTDGAASFRFGSSGREEFQESSGMIRFGLDNAAADKSAAVRVRACASRKARYNGGEYYHDANVLITSSQSAPATRGVAWEPRQRSRVATDIKQEQEAGRPAADEMYDENNRPMRCMNVNGNDDERRRPSARSMWQAAKDEASTLAAIRSGHGRTVGAPTSLKFASGEIEDPGDVDASEKCSYEGAANGGGGCRDRDSPNNWLPTHSKELKATAAAWGAYNIEEDVTSVIKRANPDAAAAAGAFFNTATTEDNGNVVEVGRHRTVVIDMEGEDASSSRDGERSVSSTSGGEGMCNRRPRDGRGGGRWSGGGGGEEAEETEEKEEAEREKESEESSSSSSSRSNRRKGKEMYWKVWRRASEMVEWRDEAEGAYCEVLGSGDELLLVRLMHKTGPVLHKLSAATANRLLSSVAMLLRQHAFFDYALPWVQQVAELIEKMGCSRLDVSAHVKRELLQSIRHALQCTQGVHRGEEESRLLHHLSSIFREAWATDDPLHSRES